MMKDRVLLAGLTVLMWTDDIVTRLKQFINDPTDKLLVVRIANETLVSRWLSRLG